MIIPLLCMAIWVAPNKKIQNSPVSAEVRAEVGKFKIQN